MRQSIHAVTSPIEARVVIPGSKSITNRALLLAALADGVSELCDMLISDDTLAFVNALRQLGISIQVDAEKHSCIVAGGQGSFPKKNATIWCADAGTVLRFLLAACSIAPGTYEFDGSEQLRQRPIAALLRTLCSQGATIQPEYAEKMPFTLLGSEGLLGGEIEVDDSETSQFLSGLLMAAPFAKTPVVLKTKNLGMHSYVSMTCTMMADFGVLVRRMHHGSYRVLSPQRYMARDYRIEPDLSTASYFFAAAAVTGGTVTIQAIDRRNSLQGDIKFLSTLEKMGCDVIEKADGLTVKGPAVLQGVSVDMRDFSDTFMTLAAIAAFAETPTIITNIGHTRLQESNRITVMRKNLENLHIKVEEGDDWIKVYPSIPVAGVVDSHHDHRVAMACSLIGLRVPGIEIDDAECVAKTCPEFFTMWESLNKRIN